MKKETTKCWNCNYLIKNPTLGIGWCSNIGRKIENEEQAEMYSKRCGAE